VGREGEQCAVQLEGFKEMELERGGYREGGGGGAVVEDEAEDVGCLAGAGVGAEVGFGGEGCCEERLGLESVLVFRV